MEDRLDRDEIFRDLSVRLYSEFGKQIRDRVLRLVLEHLGGKRISFPSVGDLARLERNKRIREIFDGSNAIEVAGRFGLKAKQIRRIASSRRP